LRTLIFLISLLLSHFCLSFDDYDLHNQVDARGFIVGSDKDIGGTFYYIVDKTNGLCFAGNTFQANGSASGGLTQIECENLKSTPMIKTYLGDSHHH